MARFLLIHGAAHGAWCWRDVIPALAALGHDALAIDLPSHGADPTPLAQVTLDAYADAILAALDAPAIVVGHSMAGFPISLAAERAPERFQRLVYLCAHTPWPGMTLSEMRKLVPEQPLIAAIRRREDGLSFDFDPALAGDLFYHDCPSEALAFAQAHLCPQAIAPSETPVSLGARYASVPRCYVVCKADRALPPGLQRKLAARFSLDDVYEMDSAHSPFLSQPEALADLLARIAA